MLKEKFNRRDAMGHILKSVALAAGISVLDLEKLLSAQRVSVSGTTQTKLKMLKVKLAGFDSKVFQSEFGRITQMRPARSMNIGGIMNGNGMGCAVHVDGAFSGANAASSCGEFSICGANGGSSCPGLDTCVENVCSGQDYGDDGGSTGGECSTNDCNGQNCGSLDTCGDNECTDQDCSGLGGCGKNKTDMVGLLSDFRNDAYVQGLMEHFHTTNMGQLATQVENMLQQKRFMTPQQVIGIGGTGKTPAYKARPITR